jgi:hypothetical protein
MSAAELRLSYRADDDGTGKIIATVRSGAFSAQGSAWFNPNGVTNTFIASLRAFPLSSTNPPMLEGGFWSSDSLTQCHLRIAVKPYNSRGTLLLQVDLASEVWGTPDADLQNSATVRFLTEYAAIDGFAEQIKRVLAGECAEAILKGITN